jgi:hypothetical protein
MIKGGDFETIADLSASVGFTAAKLRPTSGDFAGKVAHRAIIQPLVNPICFNYFGAAATVDHLKLAVDDVFILYGIDDLEDFRCIQTAAGAQLRVHYDYRL